MPLPRNPRHPPPLDVCSRLTCAQTRAAAPWPCAELILTGAPAVCLRAWAGGGGNQAALGCRPCVLHGDALPRLLLQRAHHLDPRLQPRCCHVRIPCIFGQGVWQRSLRATRARGCPCPHLPWRGARGGLSRSRRCLVACWVFTAAAPRQVQPAGDQGDGRRRHVAQGPPDAGERQGGHGAGGGCLQVCACTRLLF